MGVVLPYAFWDGNIADSVNVRDKREIDFKAFDTKESTHK